MDIKSLLNNQLIDRKRSERVVKTGTETLSNDASNSVKSKTVQDQINISATTSSDLSFAQSIYKKMDENTLDRVRNVRTKVESGYYTTDESIKKLATSLENDIYDLEASSFPIEESPRYPVDIEALKKNISENSDIYSEIADRLSKILSKI